MKPGAWWPVAVVGVLAVTVGANIAILVAARDKNAYVVEPDYYRKAVAWDTTMAEARHDQALGWQLDAAFAGWSAAGTPLTVQLADSAGAPLAGAGVHVEMLNNLAPEDVIRGVATDAGEGRYQLLAHLPRPGLWELRFQVVRGAEHFAADLRRDALRGAAK